MATFKAVRQEREEKDQAQKSEQKKQWQKPVLEDVSEKIMAQPYIRFT